MPGPKKLPTTIVIQPPVFDSLTAYGIASIAVVVAALWVIIFSQGSQKRALVLAILVVVLMIVSATAAWFGRLARFDTFPPPMLIMMASVFGLSFGLGLSSFGREAAGNVSLATLVGLQSFRFPLELVMHRAGNMGVMPVQLSYSGYNFDIVTGITALLLWIMFQSSIAIPRSVLWMWNIWGLLCLTVIAVVAIATSPVIRAFGDGPQNLNTWVLYFPYVWLPIVLVTVALSSHLIITRKLLTRTAS